MNKIKITVLAGLIGVSFLQAQHDPKAKEILDKLSSTTKSYSTITSKFEVIMDNKAEDIHESQTASIILKNDSYYLTLEGTHILSDGTSKWTVLFDAEEVTKELLVDTEGGEGDISPSEIFTLYESGFKYKYIGEKTFDEKVLHEIDLVPEDAKEKPYSRARIYIEKSSNQVYMFNLVGKNGTDMTYKFISITPNKEYNDEFFKYKTSICPDCEVIE